MNDKIIMSALRVRDNKTVKVAKDSSIKWVDVNTGELYFLHIDIELLYNDVA